MVVKRAVFLDRDGVVNKNRPDCIHNYHQFQFLPGAFDAIIRLCQNGLVPALITNQSCIGRGWVPESRIRHIHATLQQRLNQRGGGFMNVYYCPHNPKAGCRCRKPEALMLRKALSDYKAAPSEAVFVGDNVTDFLAAKNARVPFILVRTGYGEKSLKKIDPRDPGLLSVQEDLAGAVDFLLR
ncbi:MAG: HAD-IIIA family hydrolase [Planctomycetota bacterium]|nr:HAD-IIIA family hydrolase [Planctomycetota bacterium]